MGPFLQGGEKPKVAKDWHEWFAWRPVKVNGKRVWLKKIYRKGYREMYHNTNQVSWEYAETLFDLLKMNPNHKGYTGEIYTNVMTQKSYVHTGNGWKEIT